MKVEIAEHYYKDLTEWEKSTRFYVDEIRIFEKRLEEVIKANTKKDILAKVEHFQNQFILQKEQFDILQHDIREEKAKVRGEILSKSSVITVTPTEKDHVIQQKIESAEKIFKETRNEFNRFLSEVL